MKKLYKLLIISVAIFLVSCGAINDDRNEFQKLKVYEKSEKYTLDTTEPYFEGRGSDEEFKLLEKALNTKLKVTIDGKEIDFPISIEDFNSLFGIKDRTETGYNEARLTLDNGKIYDVGLKDEYIYGFLFTESDQIDYDIILPFGMLPSDTYEESISKIDKDLLVPEYFNEYENEDTEANLNEDGERRYIPRSFVADGKKVLLSYFKDRLINFYVSEPEQKSIGSDLSSIYYDRIAEESSTDAEITLNGKTFKFPIKLAELKEKTNGNIEELNNENFNEYDYFKKAENPKPPNEYELLINALINIDGYIYRFRHSHEGFMRELRDESDIDSIIFDITNPFSIKNSKFEINNDNYLEVVNFLEEYDIPYRTSTSFGALTEIEFYLDDNTRVSINDLGMIQLDDAVRSNRIIDEANYKKDMGKI